jgi:hypothetical protein
VLSQQALPYERLLPRGGIDANLISKHHHDSSTMSNAKNCWMYILARRSIELFVAAIGCFEVLRQQQAGRIKFSRFSENGVTRK